MGILNSPMPTNIEIKARVRDWEQTRRAAESLADRPLEIIDQVDTFFACPNGRLKLREFSAIHGELIAYDREDRAGAKASRYLITPTTEPEALRSVLLRALGIAGTVKKRRFLYLCGPTRIHLDDVEGLGKFLELEVVLAPGDDEARGEAIARELMEKLSVRPDDLLAGAYVDLLASGRAA
jgi:predicted adenylyl cyclase CyaB